MKTLALLVYALNGINAGYEQVLPAGFGPAWSPNGARIAYAAGGAVRVADADGTHRALLVRGGASPAWSPDGRWLAFSRDGWVWIVRADGSGERPVAPGARPAWSPLGRRIAFDRDGWIGSAWWSGGDVRTLARGTDPAFARDGRLAFVRDGRVIVRGRVVATGRQPAWSSDGRLAYVRDGRIFVDGRPVVRGFQPDWRPAVAVRELLPDFDQRPPADLQIQGGPVRWKLGFTSLVDNVGEGAAVIVGVRPSGEARMVATQRVALSNGWVRSYAEAGRLRFTRSPPHYHWHLMRFDSFELRTLDGHTIIRDRKSGFCLSDQWGIAPGKLERRARFRGDCEQHNPRATRVVQGTSPGFTDRYPAFFHGQNIELTGIPAGVYVLVHRASPGLSLRELRYENNAASARIRLSWRDGRPHVRVLRRCPETATC
jgi:hypothetical protein